VTTEMLTSLLAQRVLGWTVAPDRFLMGDRHWLPRWRFKPIENLSDAFQLLDGAAPDEYIMTGGNHGGFRVLVRIGKATGEACGASKPRAITTAIARALGIEVEP
jgi:hypothetical protein